MGRRTEYTFFQRGNADGQQAHEKMLNIIIIKEMQMKTTRRYLTPVSINKDTDNMWRLWEKGTLEYCCWECKLV